MGGAAWGEGVKEKVGQRERKEAERGREMVRRAKKGSRRRWGREREVMGDRWLKVNESRDVQ